LSQVCPEVGKLSDQRIGKLRARLSLQPTREAIRESTNTLRRELKYAVNTSMQVERHEIETERGMAAVPPILYPHLKASTLTSNAQTAEVAKLRFIRKTAQVFQT
jgi:hypothetical protein